MENQDAKRDDTTIERLQNVSNEVENLMRPIIRGAISTFLLDENNRAKQMMEKKEEELSEAKKVHAEEVQKLKAAHQEERKHDKISIENVKKIVLEAEEWKKTVDVKNAELLEFKGQTATLKTQIAKLEEDKKSLEASSLASKTELDTLKQMYRESDDKVKRLRTIAVKHRDENKKLKEDAAKARNNRENAVKDTQTDSCMVGDTNTEMEIMKKMFEEKINNLNERLEKEVNARRDDIEAQEKRQAEMDAELDKAKEDKNRLMQNAKRKILDLKKELDDTKAELTSQQRDPENENNNNKKRKLSDDAAA